jgi:hypothetical protein
MTRVLAVADEVDERLTGSRLASLRPDLVVACGDLPLDYLEYLVTLANVPLLFVPGNHDPDLARRPGADVVAVAAPALLRAPERAPTARGCTNIDGRLVEAASLCVAGLGGCIRYSRGPHQYTQTQMARRARALERRRRFGAGRVRVDVVVAHAPPLGVGDGDDPAHEGAAALGWLIERWGPKLLVHGHVHNYGRRSPDRCVGATTVVNAVGHRCLEVDA